MDYSKSLVVFGIATIALNYASANANEPLGLSFDLEPVQPPDPIQSHMLPPPLETGLGSDTRQNEPFNHYSSSQEYFLSENMPQDSRADKYEADLQGQTHHGAIYQIPETWWWEGSNSPLAIAIGAAEGTRQPDGTKNSAYYWHTDPGNAADNFGTFSYQHLLPQEKALVREQITATDKRVVSEQQQLPELADARQLKRLRQFHDRLRQQALAKGMSLSQLELVNGLDLANQSEAAALSEWGYIDRLAQMKELIPNDPIEQIKEARTWSYWEPKHNAWNAPGLGNTYSDIRWDQERRFNAVARSLEQQQQLDSRQPQKSGGQEPLQFLQDKKLQGLPQHPLNKPQGDADMIAKNIIEFEFFS